MANKFHAKKRCEKCNALIVKGVVMSGIIEIQCGMCGHITTVKPNFKFEPGYDAKGNMWEVSIVPA